MKENEQIKMMKGLMSLDGASPNPCISRGCELFIRGKGCTSEQELVVGPEGVECGDGKGIIRVTIEPKEIELISILESNLV